MNGVNLHSLITLSRIKMRTILRLLLDIVLLIFKIKKVISVLKK